MRPQRRAGPVPCWGRETLLSPSSQLSLTNQTERQDGGGKAVRWGENEWALKWCKKAQHFGCLKTNYSRRACCRMFCPGQEDKTQAARGHACIVAASDEAEGFFRCTKYEYLLTKDFRADIFPSRQSAAELLPVLRFKELRSNFKDSDTQGCWQIKHFGSGQPFIFFQGQIYPGEWVVTNPQKDS